MLFAILYDLLYLPIFHFSLVSLLCHTRLTTHKIDERIVSYNVTSSLSTTTTASYQICIYKIERIAATYPSHKIEKNLCKKLKFAREELELEKVILYFIIMSSRERFSLPCSSKIR